MSFDYYCHLLIDPLYSGASKRYISCNCEALADVWKLQNMMKHVAAFGGKRGVLGRLSMLSTYKRLSDSC